MIKDFFFRFRTGALSLKTVLAIYFIPISTLPSIFLAYYATRLFEVSTQENLVRRANSERDAILAEFESTELNLLTQARTTAASQGFISAVRRQDTHYIREFSSRGKAGVEIRVYSPDGKFLARNKTLDDSIPYISQEGLIQVKTRNETVDRYFSEELRGFVTVIRLLIRDKESLYGIFELEYRFGQKEITDLSTRRGIDLVLLNRDFTKLSASFALSNEALKTFSIRAFPSRDKGSPILVRLGDSRFSAFLFDFPFVYGKNRNWGYLGIFISMTSVDATVAKLKTALIYLSLGLIIAATLLIFLFSNRLVKPIERLVAAMKRMRIGRMEQISTLESTYEIEYLVRSFNDMARNVTAAKRALEVKLDELHRANEEIKNTQGQLVHSAKMVSLGQLVAGVAHELNNPIAFIFSNMHHLTDYVTRIRKAIETYRNTPMSDADKERLQELEKKLEIDYVLKDIEDLTKSCLDGANRVKEIVSGLRTFSRMEESEFRSSNIQEGLRATLKLLSSEFKDRITVHEIWNDIPQIECNLSQINQVFMNLLTNAAQAITGKGDIWIRASHQSGVVTIEIEDSGCGIPESTLSKVFDPFFTTKKVGEGTGLGLSIAYNLIQKHQGNIEVMSTEGKGTRFIVVLPVSQAIAKSA